MAGIWSLALLGALFETWANLVLKVNPETVLAVSSWHAEALEQSLKSKLERELQTGEFITSPEAALLVRANPLSDWPFIQLALSADDDGEVSEAEGLMLGAYRRDPRNVLPIAWLAQRASGHTNGADAMRWLDRLLTVNPDLSDDWSAMAVHYALEPGGTGELLELLKADRIWARGVVGELNKTYPDLPFLLELNRLAKNQQGAFLQRILTDMGPEVAFEAWISLVGASEPESMRWPFDPEFEGLDAPRPFNWAVNNVFTEMNSGEGLFAVYRGRGQTVLARQVLMLHPGMYQLVVDYSGQTHEAAGSLVWEVSCLGAPSKIAILALDNPRGGDARSSLDLEIPENDCAAQRLVFKGKPGQYPGRTRIVTRSVRIEALAP